MGDNSAVQLTKLPRYARLHDPVEKISSTQVLKRCLHCDTRTWPIGRDDKGKYLAQCLCCGQRYMLGSR